MFSIGLTVLSAGVLEDFSNLYDIKLHTFNEDKLQRKLDEWRINEKYSEVLKSTVDNLCEIDPAKRFSSH